MKSVMPSARTEARGLRRVESVVEEDLGWLWRTTPKHDYGFDGEIEVVEHGDAKGIVLKAQVRSGTSFVRSSTTERFRCPVSKDDIEYWSNSNIPVVLLVYDLNNDSVYWKEIRSWLDSLDHKLPTGIIFRRSTEKLDVSSKSALLEIAMARAAREQAEFYLLNSREKLFNACIEAVTQSPKTLRITQPGPLFMLPDVAFIHRGERALRPSLTLSLKRFLETLQVLQERDVRIILRNHGHFINLLNEFSEYSGLEDLLTTLESAIEKYFDKRMFPGLRICSASAAAFRSILITDKVFIEASRYAGVGDQGRYSVQ